MTYKAFLIILSVAVLGWTRGIRCLVVLRWIPQPSQTAIVTTTILEPLPGRYFSGFG